jgi:uncharacterized tellurite resistance protein B-like protein
MFSKVKNLFKSEAEEAKTDDLDPLQYAAAVLLFEVAAVDGHIGEDEESLIEAILVEEFNFSPDEAAPLLEAAKLRAQTSVQLLPAVRAINDNYSDANKEHLFELLWRVVLADGTREDYESVLLRRLAGLLYVSDKASGIARRRATNKLETS